MQPERDFATLSITAALLQVAFFKLQLDPQEVRFCTLAGSAALLPVQPQGDHDLAFPQWNGAESRHLDFICQHFIVALDQPNLRRSLDGDVFAQLQVMNFLFKAVHGVYKISYHLGANGIALGCRLGMKLQQAGNFIQYIIVSG